MSEKPEALRLAERLNTGVIDREGADTIAAAAELRRLSAVEAQRDALLAVVNKLEYSSDGYIKRYPEESEVSAAIKAVEENT